MAQANIEIEIRVTWVCNAAIFVCRYLKAKWLLRKLCKLTAAKLYINGKLSKKLTIGEFLPNF
jgi:hypothetical protein